VKYYNKEDADHFIESLRKHYEISIDWSGKNYCVTSLKWDYAQGYVDMSMPGYIDTALKKFNHPQPSKLQYAQLKTSPIHYGKIQDSSYNSETESPF